jgi:ATP-dependent Clp protease ATP-binding subunit ClpC
VSGFEMSPGAEILWRRIGDARKETTDGSLTLNPSLQVILNAYFQLTQEVGLLPDMNGLKTSVQEKSARGDAGAKIDEDAFVTLAGKLAAERGQSRIFERDLVAALLSLAGIPLRPQAETGWSPTPPSGTAATAATQPTPSSPPSSPLTEHSDKPDPAHEATPATAPSSHLTWKPFAGAPTLEKLGRDLTSEAAAGKLAAVLGRDEETSLLVETLCRDTKRNPLLLGAAGVGKTAIVEGLAQRVVRGEVPKNLVNVRIFALQTSDLVQGTGIVGALEERMKSLIKEAESPGVILFLDEIHAVVGAGAGGRSTNDVANILKPALARGAMACIGATTDGEYARYLVGDAAFERRFQPLRVNELPRDATLAILQATAIRVGERDGIAVEPEALEAIVTLADRFMRNRYRPDKALDIFQHTLARARVTAGTHIGVEQVHEVVRRMVSVPLDGRELATRLEALATALVEQVGVPGSVANGLCKRLAVTMRSMDLHPTRPNTVLLVLGRGDAPTTLARVISEVVFGPEAPMIELDMSILQHPGDVNRLVGTAPGYIGYDVPLQLHLALAQHPWSVVLFRGADLAHPAVQAALAQALQEGFLLSSSGQKVYLSDAICVLTVAGSERARAKHLGFVTETSEGISETTGSHELTEELAATVDIVCDLGGETVKVIDRWVVQHLLEPMAQRYREECAIDIKWDNTVAVWLAERAAELGGSGQALEKFFETEVAPTVLGAIDETVARSSYRLSLRDAALVVEKVTP